MVMTPNPPWWNTHLQMNSAVAGPSFLLGWGRFSFWPLGQQELQVLQKLESFVKVGEILVFSFSTHHKVFFAWIMSFLSFFSINICIEKKDKFSQCKKVNHLVPEMARGAHPDVWSLLIGFCHFSQLFLGALHHTAFSEPLQWLVFFLINREYDLFWFFLQNPEFCAEATKISIAGTMQYDINNEATTVNNLIYDKIAFSVFPNPKQCFRI